MALLTMSQAEFARQCIEFDQELGDASQELRPLLLLQKMANTSDDEVLQMGAVWLDGHGYGDMTLENLGLTMAKLRQGG